MILTVYVSCSRREMDEILIQTHKGAQTVIFNTVRLRELFLCLKKELRPIQTLSACRLKIL